MKKILGIVVLGLLLSSNSYAWKVTSWKVVKVIGDPIYAEPNDYIGEIQYFGMGGSGNKPKIIISPIILFY